MTIEMLDLAGADERIRFSPFCWRTKMSLRHKGLDFEAKPWRFTDKAAMAATGAERVPVIRDGGKWIADSWRIALYLDEAYPDRPALMESDGARAAARFVMSWCDMVLHPAIARLAILDILACLRPADQSYFRETREKRFGMTLEAFAGDREKSAAALKSALAPMEQTLADNGYLGGTRPNYSDFALFGSLMWAHVVAKQAPLAEASAVGKWFGRIQALDGGYAASAPTVRG